MHRVDVRRVLLFRTSLIYIALVFAQAMSARSTVVAASGGLSGHVKDLCGAIIPGITVILSNQSGATFRTFTNADGRYEFHTIPLTDDDSWVVVTEMVSFEKDRRETVRLVDGVRVEHNIRVLPDLALKEELKVTHIDPKIRFYKYSAIGTVTGADGQPVSGATVTLRNFDYSAAKSGNGRCTTDELGRYYVYQWLATPPRWTVTVEVKNLTPYVQDIRLPPNEPQIIDIRLRSR